MAVTTGTLPAQGNGDVHGHLERAPRAMIRRRRVCSKFSALSDGRSATVFLRSRDLGRRNDPVSDRANASSDLPTASELLENDQKDIEDDGPEDEADKWGQDHDRRSATSEGAMVHMLLDRTHRNQHHLWSPEPRSEARRPA